MNGIAPLQAKYGGASYLATESLVVGGERVQRRPLTIHDLVAFEFFPGEGGGGTSADRIQGRAGTDVTSWITLSLAMVAAFRTLASPPRPPA